MAAVSLLLRSPSPSTLNLQIAAYIMVCFSGFLRYDDACQIFADEKRFYPSHMELLLGKRKNDQFREGSINCIARGSSHACPVWLLHSLLAKANISKSHVPALQSFARKSSSVASPTAWPYSQACYYFLSALADAANIPLSVLTNSYGLNSLRSGGATFVAPREYLITFFSLMEPGNHPRPCIPTSHVLWKISF
jgi:hypothetical protein